MIPIHTALENSPTEFKSAVAYLAAGALFFCMRSCEYLKVPNAHDKKTKLCIRNFHLKKNNNILDNSSSLITDADKVSITFEDQKNRNKDETVTLSKSSDNVLCPVQIWATTVHRIMHYLNTSAETPICTYEHQNNSFQINDKNMIQRLHLTAKPIGKEKLGFEAQQIDTHSLRSGGAMAMWCLAKVEEYRIKLIRHWKSSLFMKDIRKQIEDFADDISNHMIENESFTHVPDFIINHN